MRLISLKSNTVERIQVAVHTLSNPGIFGHLVMCLGGSLQELVALLIVRGLEPLDEIKGVSSGRPDGFCATEEEVLHIARLIRGDHPMVELMVRKLNGHLDGSVRAKSSLF